MPTSAVLHSVWARSAKYVLHHCGNARPFCENTENSNDRCKLDWSDQQKIHNECNVDHAPHDGCNTSCQHASGLSSRGGSIAPSVSPSSPSRLTRYSSDTRINGRVYHNIVHDYWFWWIFCANLMISWRLSQRVLLRGEMCCLYTCISMSTSRTSLNPFQWCGG